MSKIPPLRCLFCDHRNLASARFCNECASPLHLQPCKECGAIDKRTATNCYKCGAQFSVAAAPERAPAAAALKRAPKAATSKHVSVPAAPEQAAVPAAPTEPSPVPPLSGNPGARQTLNEGRVAIERAFLSDSPPQVVGMFRQGLRRELTETETQVQATAVVDLDPSVLNLDTAHSSVEPQPIDITAATDGIPNPDLARPVVEPQAIDITAATESVPKPDLARPTIEPQTADSTVAPAGIQDPHLAHLIIEPRTSDETIESAGAETATTPRRARRIGVLALLLAMAVAGYYYYDRSAQQLAQGQSAGQPALSMPDGRIAADATPAVATTQGDATPAAKEATPQPTTVPVEVEKAASSPAQVVAKPRTDPEPAPARDSIADPVSASRPAAMPQAAGAAASVPPSSLIKPRQDPPRIRECTEGVAALGLCSPNKPQGD